MSENIRRSALRSFPNIFSVLVFESLGDGNDQIGFLREFLADIENKLIGVKNPFRQINKIGRRFAA